MSPAAPPIVPSALADTSASDGLRLIVILPALDESATIGAVIDRIPRQIADIGSVLVLVVDDGSQDETAALARQAGAEVIRHAQTQGVGAAFATGLEGALERGADLIVNMDADGQFRPEDIPALIRPILDQGYGFVTCTRFGDPQYQPKMPRIKRWGNQLMCCLVGWIAGGPRFSDVSCGFRAYSRDTALKLNLYGAFTYTQETFIDLANKRISMTEVPLLVRGEREVGTSRVASNLFRYAFHTSIILLRALRDWKPLFFFGSIAGLFFGLGVAQLVFVAGWWLATGRTSPWTSLISLGGVAMVMGIAFLVLALIADQIGRSRKILERILYHQRLVALAAARRQP